MSTSAPDPVARRRGRITLWRRSGGATEVGFAVTVAALIVGAMLGVGLAATDVLTSDGLTWIGDDQRGTAVQINPATGEPQAELKVAPPGHPLDISQSDGLLVVRDPVTGAVTLIDVATLVSTGQRTATGGDSTEILLDNDQLYLVDRPAGTVRRIDPATAGDVGTVWTAGTALVDVALDGAGTVWALGTDGQLHSLTWSPTRQTLQDSAATRQIDGTGPQSVLVPHESGVTVIAPEGSAINRVGTGDDLSLPAPQLGDPLAAAPQAPADLVPVSVTASATVLIVHSDVLVSVDVGKLGCPHPGRPVVHRNLVYVPCLGSGKVLVLDAKGHRAASDITIADGDPKLVLDDGRLIIHTTGSSAGYVVEADGSTKRVRTHDDNVPPRDPATPPPPVIPSSTPRRPPPTTTPPGNTPGQERTDDAVAPPSSSSPAGGSRTPSSTPSRTTPPPSSTTTSAPPVRTDAPSNVVAQARGDGTVLVSWVAQGQANRYSVLRGDTLAEVASVPGGATSAIVTTLAPGSTLTMIVEADYGTVQKRSAPSAAVQVFTGPGAPGGVTVSLVADFTTTITVSASWSAAADNGSAVTGYSATIRSDRGFSQTVQVSGLTSGSVQVSCGGGCDGIRVDASVSAINAAGNGPAGTGSYSYAAPVAPVITELTCEYTGNGSNLCEVTFTGPGTTRWSYKGNALPGLDGRKFVSIGCGGTSGGPVSVTVTNISGSDTQITSISRCSGPIP